MPAGPVWIGWGLWHS